MPNVTALLRDFDEAIVNWLTGLDLQDVEGNDITAYYSALPRWLYQYTPTGVDIGSDRLLPLPVVAVKRTGFEIEKSRYVFPSDRTRLKVSATDASSKLVDYPLPVNITYEISVLDNYILGQNKIVEEIVGAFRPNEIYLNINYFLHRLRFESMDDESAAYALGDQERLFSSSIRAVLEAKMTDPSNAEDVSNLESIALDLDMVGARYKTVDDAYSAWVTGGGGYPSDPYSFREPSGDIWIE